MSICEFVEVSEDLEEGEFEDKGRVREVFEGGSFEGSRKVREVR
jgi:hypothetical protein